MLQRRLSQFHTRVHKNRAVDIAVLLYFEHSCATLNCSVSASALNYTLSFDLDARVYLYQRPFYFLKKNRIFYMSMVNTTVTEYNTIVSNGISRILFSTISSCCSISLYPSAKLALMTVATSMCHVLMFHTTGVVTYNITLNLYLYGLRRPDL